MKSFRFPLAIAFACFLAVSESSAQTASFSFNDGVGQPDADNYPAGASFTIAINLTFAPGGNVSNLLGYSYWFEQMNSLAPFYFSITNRSVTGSQFTDLNTNNLTYPQSLTPANSKDLGALKSDFVGVGAGTYFVANVTFKIDPSTPPGTYILENTTTGGKTSVISDDQGHLANIPKTTYTVTVVPFAITSITGGGGSVTVSGMGVPNQPNSIQATSDITQTFTFLATVTPDSTGAFQFVDNSPGTKRFYELTYP